MNTSDTTDGGSTRPPGGSTSDWLRPWRHLFWLVGLAALVVLFYAEENWRGKTAWENYRSALKARGQAVDASAFIPPPVPDDANFAQTPFLAPLFEFVPGPQRWRDTNALRRAQGFAPRYEAASRLVDARKEPRTNSWIRSRTDLREWALAFSSGTNQVARHDRPKVAPDLTHEQAALAVLEGLSECQPVLDELLAAARRPQARFNIRYEQENPAAILLPHLAVLKKCSQILRLRASAEIALGRMEEALNDVNLIFSLSEALRNEPILISQLVRIAQVQLALQPLAEGMGQWSEAQLQALEERLQGLDLCASTRRSLEAEAGLFGCGYIDYVRHAPRRGQAFSQIGDSGGGDNAGFELVGVLFSAAPSGWLDLEKLNYSRAVEENLLPTIDLADRRVRPESVQSAQDRMAALRTHSPPALFLRHEIFASFLLPAVSGVAEKAAFAQTAVDLAGLACALERYRLVKGKFPSSLEELVPQFASKLPRDIINGQALEYRLADDGNYVLYSVGWDGRDNQAAVTLKKGGESIDLKEGDWVWRPRVEGP
jgi:hypothetical protein